MIFSVIRRTKKTTLAFNLFLLLVAVGGGTISTYISLTDLKVRDTVDIDWGDTVVTLLYGSIDQYGISFQDTNFKPPCYMSVFTGDNNVTFGGGDAGGTVAIGY